MKNLGKLSVLGLLTLVLAAGCGSDDGDDGGGGSGSFNACFAQCSVGNVGCTSFPGLTEAECNEMAQLDCGGPAMEIVYERGCDCSDAGEPLACQNIPSWAP